MRYLIILIIPFLMTFCKAVKEENTDQGITGTVRWFEGNMMPSPGRKAPQGSLVKRTIVVCELTNVKDLGTQGPLFDSLSTNIVKEFTTKEDGQFTIYLKPGKYSVFTKEENGYFANSYDGENNVGVVNVEKDQMTNLKIDVNYKATF